MSLFNERSESGPWFEVGQRLDGQNIAAKLEAGGPSASSRGRPYCIYVHVPFCSSRCVYCALYTRVVCHDPDSTFDEYLAFLERAIRAHPVIPVGRPPTTVHFGGGTPLFIGITRFRSLANVIRSAFGDAPSCEWAVETTTSSIHPETVTALSELRFTRIHLGIQTLDNEIRRTIGRRESQEKALDKIHLLLAHGFLLSVDLIIGFEQSTHEILYNDLRRLYAAGVRMFSICELRHLRKRGIDNGWRREEAERNYAYWQLIWDFMEAHGLIPIHLGQFARAQEDNLYFTHPARGEDCVALGPYAHGSQGRIYYQNKLLPHYYDALKNNQSPIDFGVLYDRHIQQIRTLESQLLSHHVSQNTIDEVKEEYGPRFEEIFECWLAYGLLTKSAHEVAYTLSREGSWFVGNMVQQVRGLAASRSQVSLQRSHYPA